MIPAKPIPTTRTCALVVFILTTMTPIFAAIGATLDAAKQKYGTVEEVSTYRPDLYPTSYIFRAGGAKIEVAPLPTTIPRIEVFFEKSPSETTEGLLERYSGRSGWQKRSLLEKEFEQQFPLFSTTASGNSFFATEGLFALVQRDVGGFKLVLAIQSADYRSLLEDYRKKMKARKP